MNCLATLLEKDNILINLKLDGKRATLQYIADHAAKNIGISDANTIFRSLLKRENIGSTGFGNGIAIPHSKIQGLKQLYCGLYVLAKPIKFESIDNKPVDIIILLLAQEDAVSEHLKIMAKIARLFRQEAIVKSVRQALTVESILTITEEIEKKETPSSS